MSIIIRNTKKTDLSQLLAIYAPYIEKTAISFEYEVPSLQEFEQRWQGIVQTYPYLVLEQEGQILGYAYASAFHPREAYQWLTEVSIYLAPQAQGKGLGKFFYQKLEACLKAQGVLSALACIATTDQPDDYLSNNSFDFHKHLGFREVGHFKKSGYKFGHWYDMKWLEKDLDEKKKKVQPIKAFKETELFKDYEVINSWFSKCIKIHPILSRSLSSWRGVIQNGVDFKLFPLSGNQVNGGSFKDEGFPNLIFQET